MIPLNVWMTKEQAGEVLGPKDEPLSVRRVEELILKLGWKAERMQLNGDKRRRTYIQAGDVLDYKASLKAQTLDGTTGAVVSRETAEARNRDAAPSRSDLYAGLARLVNALAAPPAALPPPVHGYEWLTVEEAAAHVRLPVNHIVKILRQGIIHSVGCGKSRRVRRDAIERYGTL